MSADCFKIFVDRLAEGNSEKISLTVEPQFMDLAEGELKFSHPVELKGRAYVSDQSLFLHLSAKTTAHLPCSICNQMTQVSLDIPEFVHAESVAEIKGKVYDFSPIVREALLLELPYTAECAEGKCPEREKLKQYFSKSGGEYSPFQDL
jgi:uncharacterized metal-binding protein YceD (DUF177 family)